MTSCCHLFFFFFKTMKDKPYFRLPLLHHPHPKLMQCLWTALAQLWFTLFISHMTFYNSDQCTHNNTLNLFGFYSERVGVRGFHSETKPEMILWVECHIPVQLSGHQQTFTDSEEVWLSPEFSGWLSGWRDITTGDWYVCVCVCFKDFRSRLFMRILASSIVSSE